jgi:hypothetical protein
MQRAARGALHFCWRSTQTIVFSVFTIVQRAGLDNAARGMVESIVKLNGCI